MLQQKPPVVTVMGHVDHGKTTLLDYIRKTKLASKEVGEITQSIGAYQIETKDKKITFIDTPGHEAFSKMRIRGAEIADIVVLVVSANDGVMAQTKECIKLILETKVPFVVAVTKMDLPEASIDKVKSGLAENEVFVEGYGGNVVCIPVSAKTGEGIDPLLEMILLTAEMLELKADPDGDLEAVIIESKFDKQLGSTATLIVKNGSLKKGSTIWVGDHESKVRMLKNCLGDLVDKVDPGDPALILGFSEVPSVGATVTAVEDMEVQAREKKVVQKLTEAEEKKLKLVLRADVSGSLEALLGCLPPRVIVMDSLVGDIKESDILLAKTLGAEVYGFNVNLPSNIEKLGQTEDVRIKTFKIIYDLITDLQKEIKRVLEPDTVRKILGKAEILATFDMKGVHVAGAKMLEGKINKSMPILIKRGETELANTRIVTLKEQKQDISEVLAGKEFGISFAGKIDFLPHDMVLSYSLEEN